MCVVPSPNLLTTGNWEPEDEKYNCRVGCPCRSGQRHTPTLFPVALSLILTGCGVSLPPDPWFVPDRFISPADTVKLASLYCECVPYRCELARPGDPEARLLAAVRDGRGVSMADVAQFGSVSECKTGLLWETDIPGAGAKLRAFKSTVRPVD